MTAPGPDKPPPFCAHCVEERSPLTRSIRRGRTVWLCAECLDPLGALGLHTEGGPTSRVGTDGGRRRGGPK